MKKGHLCVLTLIVSALALHPFCTENRLDSPCSRLQRSIFPLVIMQSSYRCSLIFSWLVLVYSIKINKKNFSRQYLTKQKKYQTPAKSQLFHSQSTFFPVSQGFDMITICSTRMTNVNIITIGGNPSFDNHFEWVMCVYCMYMCKYVYDWEQLCQDHHFLVNL